MITYNNTSKLLFSQGNNNTAINLKSKASQQTTASEFKSVFDKTMNNTAKRTNYSSVSETNKDTSQNSAPKVKYKTFRELEMRKDVSAKQNSVEKSAQNMEIQNVNSETDKITSGPDEYDETINALAQMLGLQPSQLVKLANELGFSVEDLKDVKKLALFMDKLAVMLELNDSQKEILIKLGKEASKQVKAEDGIEVATTGESSGTAPNNNTKAIDLSRISDEVKAKLNQLIQKATVNPEAVDLEISKVIEAMKAQKQAKVTVVEQIDTKVSTGSTTSGIPNAEQLSVEGNATNVKESAKARDLKEADTSESTDSSDAKTTVNTQTVNTVVNSDQNQQLNQQNMQTIGDVKVGTINNQTVVEKSVFTMPQPIKTSEVLNQVVEQAKVIIGQDKTEMVIQLKPDHLGKLELKVVTEQGIVAAKFIAESQQVKEVIETNMQLLKDSLQKQGISIDGISVQVGNDKQGEFKQQNLNQSKNNSSGNRLKHDGNGLGISNAGINAFDTLPERLAQYAYESNTINLTA